MNRRGELMSQLPLPAPVREAINAVNAGDIEAFLALFAPDTGYVKDWGRKFRGIEAIRSWGNHEFFGQHVKLQPADFYLTGEGDTVVIAEVGGFGFRSPNAFTFHVDGKLLANMRTSRY
jgi:ketosteroid isomerase-like protein